MSFQQEIIQKHEEAAEGKKSAEQLQEVLTSSLQHILKEFRQRLKQSGEGRVDHMVAQKKKQILYELDKRVS